MESIYADYFFIGLVSFFIDVGLRLIRFRIGFYSSSTWALD